jgi:hypothetical protein
VAPTLAVVCPPPASPCLATARVAHRQAVRLRCKATVGSLSPLSPAFWGGRGRSGGLELRSSASMAAAAWPPGSSATTAGSGGRAAGACVVCCGGGGWCCEWRRSWSARAAMATVASGFGGIGRYLLWPVAGSAWLWPAVSARGASNLVRYGPWRA